jgi:hypothetical protein
VSAKALAVRHSETRAQREAGIHATTWSMDFGGALCDASEMTSSVCDEQKQE